MRADVEENSLWQQVISYIVFKYRDSCFVYRYLENASEKRLKNDFMVGIGGHIDMADGAEGDVIETAVVREWDEEVKYDGVLSRKIIGILNDDSRPVERVHVGLVYLFEGDTPNIEVREKDVLEGKMVPFKNLGAYLAESQGWAPILHKEYLSKLV